jgi:NAD dependent epimerase/dehydratase family enzyme
MRAPATVMRLALGEMADAVILNGQRVLPARALAMGFRFQYPTIDVALLQIYGSGLRV